MSMFNKVTKTFQWGPAHRQAREPARSPASQAAPVLVNIEDTVVLATVVGCQERQAGPGLLPADRRLHREDLRRRQDPRQLLQA
jgi:polyribonucleotide nucleotidyltransferase